MAASATNTSREIGAVAGVAVLGALVDAKLHSDIIASMQALHIGKIYQTIVINGVETGLVPNSGQSSSGTANLKLEHEVIQAAYHAFSSGLHAALYLSAVLVLAAGLFSFVLLTRRGHAEPGRASIPAMPPTDG